MNIDFNFTRRRRSFDESEQKLLRHHTWGAVAGAAVSIGAQLLKPKPKAGALADPIDLNAEAKRSITGNISNQDDIEQLLSRANTFSADQNIALMEKAMPGYGALAKKFTGQADELLTDPYSLPKDVETNLARLAAERGISAGTKGEFNDFSLMRDFGINSLNYGASRINQAQGITQMLASLAPKVNPLSPMNFYVTPAQQAQVAAGNQANQQASNNATAAANNYNQGQTWDTIASGVGTMAGAYFNNRANNTGNKVPDYNPPGSMND